MIAVVLVSAFASGSGLVRFTVLSRHGVSSGSQLYLTMGLGTCFSIAVAASVGAFDVPPEKGLAAWLSVLCVCVFGTLATLFMVYAVRLDSATTLALCLELDVALKLCLGRGRLWQERGRGLSGWGGAHLRGRADPHAQPKGGAEHERGGGPRGRPARRWWRA